TALLIAWSIMSDNFPEFALFIARHHPLGKRGILGKAAAGVKSREAGITGALRFRAMDLSVQSPAMQRNLLAWITIASCLLAADGCVTRNAPLNPLSVQLEDRRPNQTWADTGARVALLASTQPLVRPSLTPTTGPATQ